MHYVNAMASGIQLWQSPSHAFQLCLRNLYLRFQLISRNSKARCLSNLHHSIHIFCCL